ncbi:MAG TPA: MFS transporter [Verrucomicrobiae bacterium]|nr:MFS transporter [Verrucomicrobiae bacterium]
MRLQTLPIFLTFLLMGVADAMGPLSDAVKNQYQLSNVVSTLLAFFVFIAFAVFSVPGGFLAARIGKKKLLLLGLALNVLATLVPSVMEPDFVLLLACIFLLGIGTTFLQVAGNPIMRDVSAPGNYSRNLSFAQGIKGIGSTVSTYLVTAFASIALFKSMGWRGSFPLFCILMFIALVAVAALKVEETQVDKPPGLGGALALLGQPVFFFAVLGIFLYVGAEASMGRFLFPFMKSLGMDEPTASKFGSALFFAMLTVGRLLGGFVLMVMSARTCFRLSALLGLVGGLALMTGSKPLAIFGVFAAGLGFANIWPMLFSITVEEKPERANELSGLMCMAISGGALVPLLMGRFLDMGWKSFSFIVPVACFIYLLVLSLRGSKKAVAAAPAKA